jgi:hypothetical protein
MLHDHHTKIVPESKPQGFIVLTDVRFRGEQTF